MILTRLDWWKAALIRALRTALVVAIPYVPASYVGNVPYLTIASASALGFVLSLITSLAGLAEVAGDKQPWWYALTSRVVKTVAQAAVAGMGTAVLITDVHWDSVWQMAVTAGFGSLVLAVLAQLPETDKPLASTSVETIVVNADGDTTKQATQIVAAAEDGAARHAL